MSKLNWLKENGIQNVECIIPDMNGVLRGKLMPADQIAEDRQLSALKFPRSVFAVTIMGEYTGIASEGENYQDADLAMRLDFDSLRFAPGFKTPTAYLFADPCDKTGQPWPVAPRNVLKAVLELYRLRNWRPIVAPELEFYLTAPNTDPMLPLSPAIGRSGRAEISAEPYGLQAIEEFQEIVNHIYDYGAVANLDLDTMIHESGCAQMEINFKHGDPLALSDQVVLFKRIVRQAALANSSYATFMAKPMEGQPGSSMHLHLSLVDYLSGQNLFSTDAGGDSDLFLQFVGGLQKYLPQIMPLFAPFTNSFRRLKAGHSAPVNVEWGFENRSCGLRVPQSDKKNHRIENRLPGADANPYLAMASTLLAGYLGIMEQLSPATQLTGNAYRSEQGLPRTMDEALLAMQNCQPILKILDPAFITAYCQTKFAELDAFQAVITPWERQHLLLKV